MILKTRDDARPRTPRVPVNPHYRTPTRVKLTKYQEHRLVSEWRGGSNRVLEFLIENNIPMVKSIARKYTSYKHKLTYEELISAGVDGLLRGLNKFDLAKDSRISTYVGWWIRQNIIRTIHDTGSTIKVPVHAHDCKIKDDEVLEPDDPKVLLQADKMRALSLASIDDLKPNAKRQTLQDTIANPEALTPEDELDLGELVSQLKLQLSRLPERQRHIIQHRFGFGEGIHVEMTLEELGAEYNLSRERIRQIQDKALEVMERRMPKAFKYLKFKH